MSWLLKFLKHHYIKQLNNIKTTFVPRGYIRLALRQEINKLGEEEQSKNFVYMRGKRSLGRPEVRSRIVR